MILYLSQCKSFLSLISRIQSEWFFKSEKFDTVYENNWKWLAEENFIYNQSTKTNRLFALDFSEVMLRRPIAKA